MEHRVLWFEEFHLWEFDQVGLCWWELAMYILGWRVLDVLDLRSKANELVDVEGRPLEWCLI